MFYKGGVLINMNIFQKMKFRIQSRIEQIKNYYNVRKYKKIYPDYEDNEYNMGSLKFIWGIKSWDDLSEGEKANLYTMNDIDIVYDRETKLYSLCIETAYIFDEDNRKQHECKYLRQLLDAFTNFVDRNNYSKNYDICLFMNDTFTKVSAESIEKLYANFKIYVEGYCKFYGY